MDRIPSSPASDRLEWILEGLDGRAGWGGDAEDVLAPAFTCVVTPAEFRERVHARAQSLAPLSVVGIDVSECEARARLRRRDGEIDVVHCTVEPEPPHRIAMAWTMGEVPAGLVPRLPDDFSAYDMPRPQKRTNLIVFSGLPGSGKSTLADMVGEQLQVPVFAIDWLLGALTPFGGRHFRDLIGVGEELLTTLAVRQLGLGQSAVLDAPVENVTTRSRWRSLASRAGAAFTAVHCHCPDPDLHRRRLQHRGRQIPGWHVGGDWENVEHRKRRFQAWESDALVIDTSRPVHRSVEDILRRLQSDGFRH